FYKKIGDKLHRIEINHPTKEFYHNTKNDGEKNWNTHQSTHVGKFNELPNHLKSLQKEETVVEVSPPGWSGTVKAMKKHKEIDNPFALAWSMKNKGDKPHYKPEPKKEEIDVTEA